MSKQRVPLASVPNVINSPFRAVAAAASKRPRAQGAKAGDLTCGQPPLKKQIIEIPDPPLRTPTQKRGQYADGRAFSKRSIGSQPTAFERKLLAVKDKTAPGRVVKNETPANRTMETVRQWRAYYRKAFPSFVFYFESIPEDVRKQCSKDIAGFGAREEKFFSRDVTHIVTTRTVPVDSDSSISTEGDGPPPISAAAQENRRPRTINPSLLENPCDNSVNHQGHGSKSKFAFDTMLASTRAKVGVIEKEKVRKQQAGNDVLRRAKEMGTKIWQLEKFERIVYMMLEDGEEGSQSQHNHNTRSNVSTATTTTGRQVDLSHLLRNEQLNGPSDRESTLTSSEIITLKGPYIYIHDMNETTKPIMVREYPKVQNREDGIWPRFRSVGMGKCPFVEEAAHAKREIEREKAMEVEKEKAMEIEQLAQAKAENLRAPRTRATTANESTNMQPPSHIIRKRPLAEMENGGNSRVQSSQQLPAIIAGKSSLVKSQSPMKGIKHFPGGIGPGFIGGEPTASGMQQSNITSAIRSQMISSTAAAPGAKAGISKDIHELKRKVLERNSGPPLKGLTASARMTTTVGGGDSSNSIPPRLAKQKAQEKLGQRKLDNIQENACLSENEEKQRKVDKFNALKVALKRDPKPGYCENCRDKFDDFEEHTLGRKHRKFAVTQENWRELDSLLKALVRPLREDLI